MNIPDDVYNAADAAYFATTGDGLTASYLVIAEWARKEALREAAEIAHMVHYAAECSTDGMLGVGMQSRSNAAFEIRNTIRALADGATS